jgi:hypothetical protein
MTRSPRAHDARIAQRLYANSVSSFFGDAASRGGDARTARRVLLAVSTGAWRTLHCRILRTPAAAGRAAGRQTTMYAHVNIWTLSASGATSENAVAARIAERLERAPGFRSYTLVRTGDREVVVVTVFESQHQLEAALGLVGEIVSREITPLVEGSPSVRQGNVLFHATAS